MPLKLSSLFICCLFACYLSEVTSSGKRYKFESCSFNNADNCASIILFYGAPDIYLPQNPKEMKDHCGELKSAVKCVSDWSRKCLKGFARQGVTLMINGPAKNIRERCSPKGSQFYLSNYQCIYDSRRSLDNCMHDLKVAVARVKGSPRSEWLPTSCCFFDQFLKCYEEGMKPFCDENGKKFLSSSRDAYIGDTVDLVCNKNLNFEGERCHQLLDNVPPANLSEVLPKSVLLPAYQLFLDYQASGDKLPEIPGGPIDKLTG